MGEHDIPLVPGKGQDYSISCIKGP
jgi:hypothetical protein